MCWQEMSVEDVEQIMDDARDGIAYANVRPCLLKVVLNDSRQEVNELLAGKLTTEVCARH
jgi:hypothetical protein